MAIAVAPPPTVVLYAVGGMHCGSCARRVETALASVQGVLAAHIDPVTRLPTVDYGSTVSDSTLAMAVANADYTLHAPHARPASTAPVRSFAFGVIAVAGLLAFYLGLITLAQGWEHAVEQFTVDRWFVAAIAMGIGTQVGSWSYLRNLDVQATAGGVAASTGMSGTAMLACCAHHLADILPIVGVSGAAILLNSFKMSLLWVGIVMNILGIIYLIRTIMRQQALAMPAETVHTGNRKGETSNERSST